MQSSLHEAAIADRPTVARALSATASAECISLVSTPRLLKPVLSLLILLLTYLEQVEQDSLLIQLYGEAKANHSGIFACEFAVC